VLPVRESDTTTILGIEQSLGAPHLVRGSVISHGILFSDLERAEPYSGVVAALSRESQRRISPGVARTIVLFARNIALHKLQWIWSFCTLKQHRP